MTGPEFRAALARHDLSQVQFARMIGVNGRTVRRWAAGEIELPGAVVCLLALLDEREEMRRILEWRAA